MAAKTNNQSALQKFFKENKSMVFMLPLLAVLIIVVVIVYSNMGKDDSNQANVNVTTTPSPTTAAVAQVSPTPTPLAIESTQTEPKVDVLPQTERESDEAETKVVKDPFEAPMKLTGIFRYSDDKAVAIIESGNSSFIVGLNEIIGETSWKVLRIYEKSVTLDSNGNSMLLELSNTEAVSAPADQGG